jgi:hypothetical protein
MGCGNIWTSRPTGLGEFNPDNIMKLEFTTLAVSLGLIGTAAFVISRVHPVLTAESLVGFGVVAALLATAALDYRLNWKSLIGR